MTTFSRLLRAFVLATLSTLVFSFDFSALKPEGYISDFAHVIPPATKAQLERYCTAVEQATGAQMAIVTIDTLEGEPVEDVANLLFRKWGIGSKKENEGALLLLAVKDRRVRLEVGYGLEPILPDGFAGSVLDAMRPALREQNFSDAVIQGTRIIGERIAKQKGVTIQSPRTSRPMRDSEGIPLPLIIVGIVFIIILLSSGGGGSGFLIGNILGMMSGGGGGGRRGGDGGGFGGYDGGGFGGFGGGDSGGGGASRDW